jgi:hypothetical protein
MSVSAIPALAALHEATTLIDLQVLSAGKRILSLHAEGTLDLLDVGRRGKLG